MNERINLVPNLNKPYFKTVEGKARDIYSHIQPLPLEVCYLRHSEICITTNTKFNLRPTHICKHQAETKLSVNKTRWLTPRLRFVVVVFFVFLFFLFCFFLVEISSRTLIPLFRPGSVNSGSTSRDDKLYIHVKRRKNVFLQEHNSIYQ